MPVKTSKYRYNYANVGINVMMCVNISKLWYNSKCPNNSKYNNWSPVCGHKSQNAGTIWKRRHKSHNVRNFSTHKKRRHNSQNVNPKYKMSIHILECRYKSGKSLHNSQNIRTNLKTLVQLSICQQNLNISVHISKYRCRSQNVSTNVKTSAQFSERRHKYQSVHRHFRMSV